MRTTAKLVAAGVTATVMVLTGCSSNGDPQPQAQPGEASTPVATQECSYPTPGVTEVKPETLNTISFGDPTSSTLCFPGRGKITIDNAKIGLSEGNWSVKSWVPASEDRGVALMAGTGTTKLVSVPFDLDKSKSKIIDVDTRYNSLIVSPDNKVALYSSSESAGVALYDLSTMSLINKVDSGDVNQYPSMMVGNRVAVKNGPDSCATVTLVGFDKTKSDIVQGLDCSKTKLVNTQGKIPSYAVVEDGKVRKLISLDNGETLSLVIPVSLNASTVNEFRDFSNGSNLSCFVYLEGGANKLVVVDRSTNTTVAEADYKDKISSGDMLYSLYDKKLYIEGGVVLDATTLSPLPDDNWTGTFPIGDHPIDPEYTVNNTGYTKKN